MVKFLLIQDHHHVEKPIQEIGAQALFTLSNKYDIDIFCGYQATHRFQFFGQFLRSYFF